MPKGITMNNVQNSNLYKLREILIQNPNDNYLKKHFIKDSFHTVQKIPGYGKAYVSFDLYQCQDKQISKEN